MNWILEGQQVTARYLNEHLVTGRVEQSRVRYGGTVCHTIELEEPINVYGEPRTRVIVHDSEILSVEENCKNSSVF